MIFSESKANIASALAKSWGQIETPKHNARVKVSLKGGGSYSFEYTDLSGIFEALKTMFKENGVAVMQNAYTENEGTSRLACVETLLLHSSGEWVKSYPLKFPAANSMQDFGGQITYMKRYSLSAMVGISTDKDDDANGAAGNPHDYTKVDNKPKNTYAKLPIPKDAKEAAQIVINFGTKHKGKTLKTVFASDPSYIQWLLENEKTDPAIVEGIGLMQLAVVQANAAKKMEQ